MRNSTWMLVTVWALATATPDRAHAQDHCNALLSHGIRNEWSSVSQKEWNNLVFHTYCRKTGNSWSFSHDGQVGLKTSIPIGIAGDWFTSQKKRDEFCRNQADQSEGREMDAARMSLLSSEALNAWNQCQQLDKRNVEIAVVDLEGRLLSFTVRRKGPADVKLKTITYEGVSGCSIDGAPRQSGEPLDVAVNIGQVNVRCTREEAEPREGIQVAYKRAEVGIDTSEGSLDINLLPVEKAYPETVEKLRQETESRLKAFSDSLSSLPNHPPKDPSKEGIVSHPGVWGKWKTVQVCPAGQYVCGYQSRFEDELASGKDDTALNAVKLFCCPFVDKLQ